LLTGNTLTWDGGALQSNETVKVYARKITNDGGKIAIGNYDTVVHTFAAPAAGNNIAAKEIAAPGTNNTWDSTFVYKVVID
jgi:hypothetical protein